LGELTGTNFIAEAGIGYDLGRNEFLDEWERATRAAIGVSQVAGTLAAGSGASRFVRRPTTIEKPSTKLVNIPKTTEESVQVKLRTYLLDSKHPDGKSKTNWFESALGFTQQNLDDLAKQIKFDKSKATLAEMTEYGQKYNQIIVIIGATGRKIPTNFIWIENHDGVIRLVTGYPK
jgi:hypothetical protein